MERNAPVLLGQKRDLGRVLESHAQLTARLDIVGAENVALREQYERAMESAHSLKEDVTALSQHNSDLSGQIQHLLARSMEGQGQGQGYSSGSSSSGRPSVALIGAILSCRLYCQLTDITTHAVHFSYYDIYVPSLYSH